MIKIDYKVNAIFDEGFCIKRSQKIRGVQLIPLNSFQETFSLASVLHLSIYEPDFAHYELGSKHSITIMTVYEMI